MSSSKIGPFSPPLATTARPDVERPVAKARPEGRAVGYTTKDEFVSGGATRNNSLTGETTSTQEPPSLPEMLEPFREALDKLAEQIANELPDLISNPLALFDFVINAIKDLGINAEHFGKVIDYVAGRVSGYNNGKDRLA